MTKDFLQELRIKIQSIEKEINEHKSWIEANKGSRIHKVSLRVRRSKLKVLKEELKMYIQKEIDSRSRRKI